jgi:hypothetical protein
MRFKHNIKITVATFLAFSVGFLSVNDTLIKKDERVPLEELTLKNK